MEELRRSGIRFGKGRAGPVVDAEMSGPTSTCTDTRFIATQMRKHPP